MIGGFDIIDLIIDLLSLAIVAVALRQPTFERRVAGLAFGALTLLHNLALYDKFEGLFYFATDGLMYSTVLLVISFMEDPPKLVREIQNISIVAVALDYFGWQMWLLGGPMTGYNASFMALYVYAVYVLLKGEPEDVGSNAMDSWHHTFRANAYSRHSLNSNH